MKSDRVTPPGPLLAARCEELLGLLSEIAREADSLQQHIAVHGTGACNGIRSRVQSIHGLAVTPEVEDWPHDE